MTSVSSQISGSSHSDLVDRLCDRFEAALRKGERPRIEDVLAEAPPEAQETLLQELIALEVEILRDPAETLPLAPYYQRFPQAAAALDALRAGWDDRHGDPAGFEVSSPPERMGETVAFVETRQKFRHFELKSILGKGGFGIVWHARDLKLQREVALKFPREGKFDESDKSLFLREARAAANLKHDNIVAVYEVSDDDKATYIASEFIEGDSLKACLQTGTFSPRDAASLVSKLAAAVQHAHEHGVIHRDLKPANVLIDRRREPHVADFGLAKHETGEESISVAGHLMGTPTYMAPEQAGADHEAVDARTDIHALGVILYELLTGSPPFRGELSVLLRQIRDVPPVAPRTIKPEIPKDLEAICLKCLEKDRSKRYQTAKALADDLHHYLNGETLRGVPAPLHDRAWKWYRRNRRQVLIASALSLIAAATAGFAAWYLTPHGPPTEYRTVLFETEPKGCEITVVKIDPDTGEPDPTQIQHAPKGKLTPLKMKLMPGDYLVVAVLPNDETWFHEVYRHVPGKTEGVPYTGRQFEWRLEKGVLQIRPIKLPRPDVAAGMARINPSDTVNEPSVKGKAPQNWRLVPFLIDRREVSLADLTSWKVSETTLNEAKNLQNPLLRQILWSDLLERQGKRLPSAAELYYVSTFVCPRDGCAGELLDGIHSDPWEWTTTKPGGPFSGRPLGTQASVTAPTFAPRMIGCGDPEGPNAKFLSGTGFYFFFSKEEFSNGVAGARGVRSIKPRRTLDDFLTPLSAGEGNIH